MLPRLSAGPSSAPHSPRPTLSTQDEILSGDTSMFSHAESSCSASSMTRLMPARTALPSSIGIEDYSYSSLESSEKTTGSRRPSSDYSCSDGTGADDHLLPRYKRSSPSSTPRWYRRHLRRNLPHPIKALIFLALLSLIGISFILSTRWTDTPLSQLPKQLIQARPWTLPKFAASNPPSPDAVTHQRSELPKRPTPIQSHLELLKDDGKYLEAWVASGEVLPGLSFAAHTHIDGLWNWVNGSDVRHRIGRNYFAQDPSRVTSPEFSQENVFNNAPHSAVASPWTNSGDRHVSEPQHDITYYRSKAKLQDSDSRFIEHDELRYSLRSAKASLGDWLRTSHVVSTDFWPSGYPESAAMTVDNESSPMLARDGAKSSLSKRSTPYIDVGQSDVIHVEGGFVRYGQLPQWLDVDSPQVRVGDRARITEDGEPPALRMHHDWSCFSYIQEIEGFSQALPSEPTEKAILDYKLQVLPTFNSMAAEASMGLNVTDLSETFFYSNDDNFMDAPMTTADFSSPLYGPVFHINHGIVIHPVEHPVPEGGEHPSLRYSAWLLAERFGTRDRYYIIHVQKTQILPLVRESRLMWGSEFAKTSAKRFRGDGRAANSHLLSYNFIIERHREALLWSYFVAKLDVDGNGHYSDDELRSAWEQLGLLPLLEKQQAEETWDKAIVTPVPLPVRESMLTSHVKKNLEMANFPTPKQAIYQFSSHDGYAFAKILYPPHRGSQWPTFHHEPDEEVRDTNITAASINWNQCWAVNTDPVELFKYMAFVKPECGDFLITLLTSKSGKKGLSAFLPAKDSLFPSVTSPIDQNDTIPHLPLNSRWADADFSLKAVARNTGWSSGSRRRFAMMLIHRYAYTIAGGTVAFEMLTGPPRAKTVFEKLRGARQSTNGTALIGINDDVELNPERTFGMFSQWMEETWPTNSTALPFEKVLPNPPKVLPGGEQDDLRFRPGYTGWRGGGPRHGKGRGGG